MALKFSIEWYRNKSVICYKFGAKVFKSEYTFEQDVFIWRREGSIFKMQWYFLIPVMARRCQPKPIFFPAEFFSQFS